MTKLEIGLLVGLLGLAMGYGVWTHSRSVYGESRKTDAGVYFRAAWAVRSGENPYKTTDDNGWHYAYPPLLAILMTPLADPPHDEAAAARYVLPYAISVALWYALTVAFVWWGTDRLASALQKESPVEWLRGQPRFGQFGMLLRLGAILFCTPAIMRAVGRGQVGTLLLLLLCCWIADTVRGKSFRGGLWLAGAICLKVIPAFLLIYPLWRRDAKMLTGCCTGLAVGLVAIPLVVMGPTRTVEAYTSLANNVLLPGVFGSKDEVMSKELTALGSTSSNSPMAVLNNLTNWATPRGERPANAAKWIKLTHVGLIAVMTALTLVAFGWHARGTTPDPLATALTMGMLVYIMTMASPVSHPHYYAVGVVLILPMMMLAWRTHTFPEAGWGWNALFWSNVLVHALTGFGIVVLRDGGLVLWGAMLLWTVACVNVWKLQHGSHSSTTLNSTVSPEAQANA